MIASQDTGACVRTAPSTGPPSVEVVNLSVEGRLDAPLGIDEPHPVLGWQFVETGWAASRSGRRNGSPVGNPGDQQTAYQIQAATCEADLHQARLIWDTGPVSSGIQSGVRYAGRTLTSRERVVWRVRVWDADHAPSHWSQPSSWEMGLLHPDDWDPARWIEHPDRTEDQALPIFARSFTIDRPTIVSRARLYLSGVGLHRPTLNGHPLDDEVLAPGNSNYQLSSEYRTYDLTDQLCTGANTLGVQLGHGPAYVRRIINPSVGRVSPYAWWQSAPTGRSVLVADAPANATNVKLGSVAHYHLGGTINIDIGDGGDRLESRTITSIGTAGVDGTGITFTPGLSGPHVADSAVTGSGNNIAGSDPSAGAAVTPRLIVRLEVFYTNGESTVIVSDRSWRTALGALVTDAWYSGADYDARREQPGWDRPGSDLSGTATRRDGTAMSWTNAGIAPPPNLATKLVARAAEPVEVVETFIPVSVAEPAPGIWVFDFGQNIVGWPELHLDASVPEGTTIRMSPAESLTDDGTVDQRSLLGGGDGRGTNVFNTYIAAGLPGGETWHPDFSYFGMQFVQVTGLPAGYRPTADLITGRRLQAAVPDAGEVTTSSPRINRIHTMARYSFASNLMSVFTDCPGREKLSYPADYTMPMGAIHRNFHLAAYLRTTMRHLVEGQSMADTAMFGNVALKAPVYDWGYAGRFGDEINWGNAIILVPWLLYDLYGDTATMARYYDQMVAYANYIQGQKAGAGTDAHIVDAVLGDWVAADPTSGRLTGTWGYFTMVSKLATMADMTGHRADADIYRRLAADIRTAFNDHFFNQRLRRYTAYGDAGAEGATQTAQALALDAGLVPDGERDAVLDALVELVYDYHPTGTGPHLSGGTIGLGPTVRALSTGGRDEVLWDVLQRDDEPGYGFFMAPTTANPNGMTTMGERWNRQDSRNHMILAQIEEWFHSSLAGLRATEGATAYRGLVIQPRLVGDLASVTGSYHTPHGIVRSEWIRADGRFTLKVAVPTNTAADVWVPRRNGWIVLSPHRAEFLRTAGDYAVYRVGSGSFTFDSQPEAPHE